MRNYKKRTKRLGIPVVGEKDGIFPEVEMRKWQLVENILMAVLGDARSYLFAEGDFSLKKQTDGTFSAILKAVKAGTPSASGVISGAFFEAPKIVRWDGLVSGGVHYLYIHNTRKTRSDPASVRVSSSRFSRDGRGRILMGVVNLTGDEVSLDRHPDKKRYSSSLSVPGMALSPKVIDFETEGEKGTTLEAGGKIAFAQVCGHRNSSPLGEIEIGYYGIDENVLLKNQIIVYNKGDAGLRARAMIFCE